MRHNQYGMSAAFLKNTAILVMLLDHCGAVLLEAWLSAHRIRFYYDNAWYTAIRTIGRLAFPIFCYLITEGAVYTRNRMRYALRLMITGFVSIVPFSLAIYKKWFSWESQNVFFTLTAGLCAIMLIDAAERNIQNRFFRRGLQGAFVLAVCAAAAAVNTDYNCLGPLLMVTFYLCRKSKVRQAGFGLLVFLAGMVLMFGVIFLRSKGAWYPKLIKDIFERGVYREIAGVLAFPLILLYNGKKGRQLPKWFYYAFYPVHLTILAVIRSLVF